MKFKWLLGENDNRNCVRDFKFTGAKELLLLNALLEDVVAVFGCHQFGKRCWLCAWVKLFRWIEMTTYRFLSTYLCLMLLKSLHHLVFGMSKEKKLPDYHNNLRRDFL